MFTLNAKQISRIVDGRLHGANIDVMGVSIDSRNLQKDNLFVAINGDNFDGHDFISKAQQKGATLALVSKVIDCDLPQIQVSNSIEALGKLAAWWRKQFTLPIIAITGSAGKTTTKEFTAAIVREYYGKDRVLVASGNLNNHLGVPLTLLQLSAQHKCAVLELGANHVGEISYTAQMVKPTIGVITNAGNAHIGEFGGLAQIVKTKGELIDGLAEGAVIILNKDDAAYSYWHKQAQQSNKQTLSFSVNNSGNFLAVAIEANQQETSFTLCAHQSLANEVSNPHLCEIKLKLLGTHNVSNALAAIAASSRLEIPYDCMEKALFQVEATNGRGKLLQFGTLTIIDDSYNANPVAVKVALNTLDNFTQDKILVLGEISELGTFTEECLQDLITFALTKVKQVVAVGTQAHLVVNFGGDKVQSFKNCREASLYLASLKNVLILVKGSRSAGLENLITLLKKQLIVSKEQSCCS